MNESLRPRRFFHPRFWSAAAALWTAGVLALALTPDAKSGWLMRTLGDKVLHGIAFGIGCLLWAKALQANPRLPRITTALVGATIAVVVGLSVEGLQEFVPSRTADLRDVVADVLGVLPALMYLTLTAMLRGNKRQ
jgi:VanZ family protein